MKKLSTLTGIFITLALISVGCGDKNEPEAQTKAEAPLISKEGQTIISKFSARQYMPITVQKGVPVKWIIKMDARDLNGCNNALTIPKLGIEKKLSVGENIIEFMPTEAGNIAYSCWMGMIRSSIKVMD